MTETFTVATTIHFQARRRGHKELRTGQPALQVGPERVPRVARLLALAIRLAGMVRVGTVRDFAELARLGGVTRARITQIMNLVHLAPDIQEEVLFLSGGQRGTGAILLAHLQPIAAELDWRRQRCLWRALRRQSSRVVPRNPEKP